LDRRGGRDIAIWQVTRKGGGGNHKGTFACQFYNRLIGAKSGSWTLIGTVWEPNVCKKDDVKGVFFLRARRYRSTNSCPAGRGDDGFQNGRRGGIFKGGACGSECLRKNDGGGTLAMIPLAHGHAGPIGGKVRFLFEQAKRVAKERV